MFCEYCGNQLEDDALFCAKCGKSTTDKKETVSEKVVLEKQEKYDSKIPTKKNHPIVKTLCNILSICFLVIASFFSIGMVLNCCDTVDTYMAGIWFSVGLNFFCVGLLLYEKSSKAKALKVMITIFKIALLILFIISVIGLVLGYTEYAESRRLPKTLAGFFSFLEFNGWYY